MRTPITKEERELLIKLQVIQEEYEISHGFKPYLQKRAATLRESKSELSDSLKKKVEDRDALRKRILESINGTFDLSAATQRLAELNGMIEVLTIFSKPNVLPKR